MYFVDWIVSKWRCNGARSKHSTCSVPLTSILKKSNRSQEPIRSVSNVYFECKIVTVPPSVSRSWHLRFSDAPDQKHQTINTCPPRLHRRGRAQFRANGSGSCWYTVSGDSTFPVRCPSTCSARASTSGSPLPSSSFTSPI